MTRMTDGAQDWVVTQRENNWKKLTLRHQTITLQNLRWWQFWRPKFQTFRLNLSMEVQGTINVATLQVELTPEKSHDPR
jgi:hypothetical protein